MDGFSLANCWWFTKCAKLPPPTHSCYTVASYYRCYTNYSHSQEQQDQTEVEMSESDRELQQRIERRMAAIGKVATLFKLAG